MVDREVNVRLQAHVSQYMASMSQASARTAAMGTQVATTMRSNQAAFTAAGVAAAGFGVAVGAGLASAVSAGAEFESRMNQVRAVSGATGAEFEQLTGVAKELGASTKFSATEAAGGLNFLSMAGFEAQESIEALPGVLDLAAAGNMELAQAADIASNVLQGFGMEAEQVGRVNDVMAATFTSANTNLNQLGDALSYVAPVASAAGMDVEETSAAIAAMSNAGVQGTRAGTSLRMALSRLIDETGPAADVLERLGVSALDSEGELRDLDDIVGQLEQSGASAGDIMELFGMRAGPAMQTLVDQGADSLSGFTDRLEDSGGTAKRVAETQMEGLSGALTELGSATEALKIRIAESGLLGAFESFADTTTGAVRAIEGLPDPVIKAGTALAGVASAAGISGGAFLILAPRVLQLTDRVGGFAAAAGRMRGGLASTARFMTGPWGLAIGAATATIVAFQDDALDTAGAIGSLETELDGMRATADRLSDEFIIGELLDAGVLGRFRQLGLNIDDVREAMAGNEEAGKRLAAVLEEDHSLLGQMGDALHNVSGGLVGSTDETRDLWFELNKLVDASEEYNAAADMMARANAGTDMERLAAEGGDLRKVILGIGDDFQRQVGPTREAAEALDDVEESSRQTAEGLGRTAESLDFLTGRGEEAFQTLASGFDVFDRYTELLEERKEAEKQAADATFEAAQDTIAAQREAGTISDEVAEQRIDAARNTRDAEVDALDDIGASWDRFQQAQQDTLEDQRNWMANLRELRERGFDDLAADLAARGPEQADMVAEAAEQSNAELEKGEQRALEIRRQKAELAMTELQSQLGNMVDASGELSQEAAEAIAEELGVTPGNVREILANSKTVADGQFEAIGVAFGTGAEEAARAAVDKLNLGGQTQSDIVSQYATQLAEGLDPIIEQVNGKPIVLPTKADWRNVPYAAGAAMAAGGMRDPDAFITSTPTVLMGEGPGAEAFIPMYEGQGASRERSRSIWQDVGRHWGFDEEMAHGGIHNWPDNIKRDRVVHFRDDAPGWSVAQSAAAWDRLNEHLDVLAGSGRNQSLVTTAHRPNAQWYGIGNAGDRISLNTAKGLDRTQRRNTATHEMGHVLGFDHPNAGSIMNPSMALGASGPTGWDAQRLRDMYPPREEALLDDADSPSRPPSLPRPEDLPEVPDLPGLGGHFRESARASMEHTREAAIAWMKDNLATRLGEGIGWEAMWQALTQQFPEADLISAFRPGSITSTGNLSYHAMDGGRAIDFDPSRAMAQWINDNYFAQTRELITPWQSLNIRNGAPFNYSDGVMALHDGRVGVRHNHWAMAQGGILGGDGAAIPTYDEGGLFPSGGIGVNTSGRDEAVIPGDMREGDVFHVPGMGHFLRLGGDWHQATGLGQLEGIEGLFGGARKAKPANIGPVEGSVEELFGGPGRIEDAVANLREWELAQMDANDRLAEMRDALADMAPWTDDYMSQLDAIERLEDEIASNRQQRIDDLQRQADQAVDSLRDMLEERDRVERRMADRRAQFEERVAGLRERHTEDVQQAEQRRDERIAEARERRDEQVAQARERRDEEIAQARLRHHERVADEIARREQDLRFDPTQAIDFAFGNTPGAIADNVRSQIEAVTRSEELLSGLREQGLDDAVIQALGLDDPRQLRTLEEFSQASEDEIARLNDAILDRNETASERAERDAQRTFTALGSTLVDMRSDLDEEIRGIHDETAASIAEADERMRSALAEARATFGEAIDSADADLRESLTTRREQFNADMAELREELQAIGQDTGRTAVEAIAEGINDGLPALREAAKEAEDVLARLGRGGSPTFGITPDDDRLVKGHFAHGGIVPGSGPQRIVAHGGERIFSGADNDRLIKAIESMGSGRSGPVQNVEEQHFHEAIDMQAWERSLVQAARIAG